MRASLLSSAAALALALAAPAFAQTPSNPLPATSSDVNTGDNAAGTPNGLPPGQSPGMNQRLTPSANTQPGTQPDVGTTSPTAGQATASQPVDQGAPGAPPQQSSASTEQSAPAAHRRYRHRRVETAQTAQDAAQYDSSDHWAHEPGTGESGPASNRASNIDNADTRSAIAPHFPTPDVGADASPARYLHAAENALASNRTGEADQALEMAETRLLDRSTLPMNANMPDQSATIQQVTEARRALASGDISAARNDIQAALATRAQMGGQQGAMATQVDETTMQANPMPPPSGGSGNNEAGHVIGAGTGGGPLGTPSQDSAGGAR